MRAHLLHLVDTESDPADTCSNDLTNAANDSCFEAPGFAPSNALATRAVSGSCWHKSAEDDAYWLGGYAGI
jgi:hypothetical protein